MTASLRAFRRRHIVSYLRARDPNPVEHANKTELNHFIPITTAIEAKL